MPPKKKSVSLDKIQAKKEVQTKLFGEKGEKVEEASKPQKSKSKQFSVGSVDVIESKNSTHRWEYGNGKTPDKLFISSWNVNGIRAVIQKQDLPKYLEKSKPDIICINETKIDEEAFQKKTNQLKLPGYHGYWNFCKCSKGYSGVAIFTKYLPISIKQDLPQEKHSQEGRVLTMQFEKFYLITAYIPNSGQKLDRLDYRVKDYDQCFQEYLQELKKTKTVILCGDLNVVHQEIDIARPKGNEKTAGFTKQERASFDSFLKKGWVDTFRKLNPETVKYSWWSMRTGGRAKGIGWRLDYFVINQQAFKKVQKSEINNDIFGSDHCPIELHINFGAK